MVWCLRLECSFGNRLMRVMRHVDGSKHDTKSTLSNPIHAIISG